MPLTNRTAETVAVAIADDRAAHEVNAVLQTAAWFTRGTAAPTTGTWAKGQVVWNTAPASGGVPGWVCTTAGSPGTWRAMAALASS